MCNCVLSLAFKRRLKTRVIPDLTISNPPGAGAGFVDNFFSDHRAITPDETNGVNREADIIPTDSVPTDAIPTICSQDDPVHL